MSEKIQPIRNKNVSHEKTFLILCSLLLTFGCIYNMQGQYVGNHISALPAGCYIMNREKIIITY